MADVERGTITIIDEAASRSSTETTVAGKSPTTKGKEKEVLGDNKESKEASNEGRDQSFLVSLDPPEDPKYFSLLRKWIIVWIVSSSALCSTSASSMVRVPRLDRFAFAHALSRR